MADPVAAALAEWRAEMAERALQNQQYSQPGPRTFATQLPPDQEQAFRAWGAQNNIPFDPNEPAQDYDMRGFYQGLQSFDPQAVRAVDPYDKKMHFPDKWKTPSHETFSADSQYATPNAPRWQDNRYLVGGDGRVLFDSAQPPGVPLGPRMRSPSPIAAALAARAVQPGREY